MHVAELWAYSDIATICEPMLSANCFINLSGKHSTFWSITVPVFTGLLTGHSLGSKGVYSSLNPNKWPNSWAAVLPGVLSNHLPWFSLQTAPVAQGVTATVWWKKGGSDIHCTSKVSLQVASPSAVHYSQLLKVWAHLDGSKSGEWSHLKNLKRYIL